MDSAGAAPPRKISVSSSSKEAAVTTAPSISSSSRRGRAVSTAACHWSEYRIPRGVLLERVRSEKLPVVDQLVSQQQQQLPNDNDHQSTLNLLEQRQQQQQQHVVNPSHSSSSSSQLPKIEEQQKKKNSGRSQSYTQLLTYCTVCGSPGHLGYECHHGHLLQRPVYHRESSSGVNANLSRRNSARSSNNNNTQQHMTDVNSSSSSNEVHTKKDAGGGGHVEQNGITKDNRIISSKDSMSAAAAMAVAAAMVTIQVGRVPHCVTNLEGAATISGITEDDNSSIVGHHHDDQNTTNLLKTNNNPSSSPSSDFISTDPVAQSSATTPDNCGVENLHNNNALQGSHAAMTSDDDLSGDDNTIPVLHSSDAIPQVNVIQSSPPQNQPKPANPGGGVLRLKHPVAKQGAQVHFLLRSRATECLMSKPKIKEEEEDDDEDMAIAATTVSCHNLIPSSLSQLQQQHQNHCFQQQPQLHDDYYYYYNNNSKDRVATVCGTVNGVLTTMLLDTGSSISAITKSFAQQLQLKTWMTGDFLVINQQQQQQQQGFLNAETIEKYPECSCLVTLKIGDHEMSEVELNVLPAQMYNVTLGKNWLKHQKAICDYELDLLQLPSRLLSCC